eukprot:scaffold9156_cov92-Skeletonema_dohrnii-CCMP3373.AAC.5
MWEVFVSVFLSAASSISKEIANVFDRRGNSTKCSPFYTPCETHQSACLNAHSNKTDTDVVYILPSQQKEYIFYRNLDSRLQIQNSMKFSDIIITLLYASTATNVAATRDSDSHDGGANSERFNESESGDRITPSISDFNIEEDFETVLLSANSNPATCTSNCRCRSNPSCTLFACKRNCSCQTGSCMMPQCTSNCKCNGASCNMPMCRNNCKCQGASCNVPMCRRNCNCQSESCSMPKCRNNCRCRGGCFSSELEEFLLAMEQDFGASDQIVTHDIPKLRGAKQATPAAVLDTTGALDSAITLAADALSVGTEEVISAANLASYEAANDAVVANDSLKDAAEITTDALNWHKCDNRSQQDKNGKRSSCTSHQAAVDAKKRPQRETAAAALAVGEI